MRARVDHAVGVIVVGPVVVRRGGVLRVDGELQHLHVGAAAGPHQRADAVGQQAQVLGDDVHLAQLPVHGVEQLHARALFPVARPRVGGIGRDREILVEAAEVIDAHDVVQFEAVPHPAHPPGVAGLPVALPAVERVAPDLAVGSKGIRRAACNGRRLVFAVQLEQVRVCPDVCAVRRNIDGDVAHDPDVPCVGISLQLRPLLGELVLQIFVELHIKVEFTVVVIHGEVPVHADIFRPALERCFPEEGLQRHEQCIIVQPPGVVCTECVEPAVLRDIAPLIGLVQQRETVLVELVEVDLRGVAAEIHGIALLAGQHAFPDEGLQADEVGAARKGGVGLIGGVVRQAVSRCAQRKDLPVALPGLCQPLHKRIGRAVKAADAVGRRQAGDGHQNTCITVHWVSTPF